MAAPLSTSCLHRWALLQEAAQCSGVLGVRERLRGRRGHGPGPVPRPRAPRVVFLRVWSYCVRCTHSAARGREWTEKRPENSCPRPGLRSHG